MQRIDYIEWTSSYLTGIETIDDGHRQFVKIYNQLVDMIKKNICAQRLLETMYALVHYAEHHLINEEICYQGHDRLSAHKENHKEFADKINHFQKEIEISAKEAVCSDLLEFLNDWFHKHILENDKEAIGFVQSKSKNFKN